MPIRMCEGTWREVVSHGGEPEPLQHCLQSLTLGQRRQPVSDAASYAGMAVG